MKLCCLAMTFAPRFIKNFVEIANSSPRISFQGVYCKTVKCIIMLTLITEQSLVAILSYNNEIPLQHM